MMDTRKKRKKKEMMARLQRRMEGGLNNPWFQAAAGGSEAFTIVRLPSHFHETNEGLYEPRLVSIGPYHLSSARTRGMQSHKWRFLRDFLLRNHHPEDGSSSVRLQLRLAAYIRAARGVEARARRCYSESLEMASDDFVQLLVLDGCFILEFLLKSRHKVLEVDAYMQWARIYIYYDLVLVENQIPFFVLAELYALAVKEGNNIHRRDENLDVLISKFFSRHEPLCHLPVPDQQLDIPCVHHLLHLQYRRLIVTTPANDGAGIQPLESDAGTGSNEDEGDDERELVIGITPLGAAGNAAAGAAGREQVNGGITTPLAIRCVTELQEFGVTFKEKPSPASQFDVTFRRGRMEIPRLAINAGTRILVANLFAWEQTTKEDWKKGVVTGYLVLMNALVNTAADVSVLQRRGILDNMLSNEEDAAAFFNRLGGCALFDPAAHRYAELFRDANEYCDHRWNRYVAVLKRDHLRSPCSIINLLAAAILMCISVTSAGFVICHYSHACS